jgi:hypothetical protein
MAIYHLAASVISRGRGQSMVAAAAYRSGTMLRDQRYGVVHNYVGKRGVVHAQILAPAGAPPWVYDREQLWNSIEAGERRKDAQLARLVEIGLPVELDAAERIALVRAYADRHFVALGMIADFAIRGDAANPHAHILLTLRRIDGPGFGPKERRWNGRATLHEWRAAWAAIANEHLARAGQAVRIDHRTLDAQQIELLPGRRIGVGRARRAKAGLPAHLTDRIAEQQRIASQNGEMILADPTVALRALTHQQPTFTREELSRFLRSRTAGDTQYEAALAAVIGCADCAEVEPTATGSRSYTSRDLQQAEASLLRRAVTMAGRAAHGLVRGAAGAPPSGFALDAAGERLFEYLVSAGDAKAVAVTASARAPLERAVRSLWLGQGWSVVEGARGRETVSELSRTTVLLIHGCHSLGVRELERALAVADHARAKAVLFADADQLQAMRVTPPFLKVQSLIGPV